MNSEDQWAIDAGHDSCNVCGGGHHTDECPYKNDYRAYQRAMEAPTVYSETRHINVVGKHDHSLIGNMSGHLHAFEHHVGLLKRYYADAQLELIHEAQHDEMREVQEAFAPYLDSRGTMVP